MIIDTRVKAANADDAMDDVVDRQKIQGATTAWARHEGNYIFRVIITDATPEEERACGGEINAETVHLLHARRNAEEPWMHCWRCEGEQIRAAAGVFDMRTPDEGRYVGQEELPCDDDHTYVWLCLPCGLEVGALFTTETVESDYVPIDDVGKMMGRVMAGIEEKGL